MLCTMPHTNRENTFAVIPGLMDLAIQSLDKLLQPSRLRVQEGWSCAWGEEKKEAVRFLMVTARVPINHTHSGEQRR